MKKALLTLAVAVVALAMGAQAQESGKMNDHKWVIGGTGRFTNTSNKLNGNDVINTTQIGAEIFGAYQLNDRLRVGLTYGMGYAHEKQPVDQSIRIYRVGPYAHFDVIKYNRWIFWVEAEALFSYSPKTTVGDMDFLTGDITPSIVAGPEVKMQGFNFTVKPGLTFVLDKHVNLDLNLNLLGWYYGNARCEVLTTSAAAGVVAGDVVEANDNGFVLDMLHATPSQYWEKVSIGITFKF